MFLLVINFFEFAAAVTGTVYINKYRNDKFIRYFVYFLWFTAFFDTIFGWMPVMIEENERLSFLSNSILNDCHWAYNIYDIISFSLYSLFFIHYIQSHKIKRIGYSLWLIYLVVSLSYLLFSDVFFNAPSLISLIFGTLLLIFLIFSFYYQVLQGEEILQFYKLLIFYISFGALVFHVSVNPIFIYSEYYNDFRSPRFSQIYRIILTSANIFMYTCYVIGFVVCLKKNK